jgi:hypothetical protein
MIVTAIIDVSGEFEFNLEDVRLKNLTNRKKNEEAKKYVAEEIRACLEDLFDEINVRNIKIDFELNKEVNLQNDENNENVG